MKQPLMAAIWLQGAAPRALVLAMLLSYVMCFAGMLFAYVHYRRRLRDQSKKENTERKP
jgi:hypothetical protein